MNWFEKTWTQAWTEVRDAIEHAAHAVEQAAHGHGHGHEKHKHKHHHHKHKLVRISVRLRRAC